MTSATIDHMYRMESEVLSRSACAAMLPGFEVVYDMEIKDPVLSFLGGERFKKYVTLSGRRYDPYISIVFITFVPCRDTGKMIEVQHTHQLSPMAAYEPEMILHALRAFIGSVLLHERDESLFVHGERKWDPHFGDGPHLHEKM